MADDRGSKALDNDTTPKLYGELAAWWPLVSAPEEYEEEAAFYAQTMLDAAGRSSGTLLELGSGGGNNASYLKKHFEMVLVDRAPRMLAVSRALNPECEHVEGDMRTLRLGRQFDFVFVHDAIMYMDSEDDLRRAMETAFLHCKPGGVALFAPDSVRETFAPSTAHGGNDGDDYCVRFLDWTWDPDPTDDTYVTDYVCVIRAADGSVRVEHDRHVEGTFARAVWLRLLRQVGFETRVVPFDHSELPPGSYELFVAVRRADRV